MLRDPFVFKWDKNEQDLVTRLGRDACLVSLEVTKAKEAPMKLLTKSIREKLIANGTKQKPLKGTENEIDLFPVVKLFTPDANCTWLLTELDPDYPDIAFGLCDLGMQCPELGSVMGELVG